MRLRAFAAQAVDFRDQVPHAVDLALAPHRHGGKGQHAVEREIVIGLVMQVARPGRRVTPVVQVHEDEGVLEEGCRQHQQREAEHAKPEPAVTPELQEEVQVDEA